MKKLKHSPVLSRFMARPVSAVAAILLILMVLVALVGPYLYPHSPYQTAVYNRFAPFSLTHPLGTDYMGRDLLARVIHGARTSIGTSLLSVLIGGTVGVLLGLLAGYFGGAIDGVVSRFVELLMALPGLLLALLLVIFLGQGVGSIIAAVSVMVIPAFARMTRSAAIQLRSAQYIEACKLMGQSDWRIISVHILRGCMPMVLITFTMNLGLAVITTASLSFVGLGIPPPYPEWGSMIDAARNHMRSQPMDLLAPALALTAFVMCSSLVGDGLREAFDPKLDGEGHHHG